MPAMKHCAHVGCHTMSQTDHTLCSSQSSALSNSHESSENPACQRGDAINMLDDISRDLGVGWFRATLPYMN